MEFFDDIIIPYEYLQQPSKLYPSTLLDLVQCSQYLSKLQCMQSRNFISHLHMLLPPSPTPRTFPDTLQSSCNLFHNKFLQTFSHYKLNKLFYTHYLSNVSCNLDCIAAARGAFVCFQPDVVSRALRNSVLDCK